MATKSTKASSLLTLPEVNFLMAAPVHQHIPRMMIWLLFMESDTVAKRHEKSPSPKTGAFDQGDDGLGRIFGATAASNGAD